MIIISNVYPIYITVLRTPLYYNSWFTLLVILLVIILGFILSYYKRKKRIKDKQLNETIIQVHMIDQHLLGSSSPESKILKDLAKKAQKQYSTVSGAKKGIVTAIKNGEDIQFFLYIRLYDESIIKTPIYMRAPKADKLPLYMQQTLTNGKEIVVINEIV